jgi:uncharacterized protein (UPF0276 family)
VNRARTYSADPVPAEAGIGLRPPHFAQVLEQRPSVPFFELHSENFFCDGGPLWDTLEAVRRDYPISLHGVGLSLGSADRLDAGHLAALVRLVRRAEPALVSEHVCWGAIDERHFNDLLPLPYTEEALALMVARVQRVQEALGRPMLVENVSSYVHFQHSTLHEWTFLAELSRRSGCGLLLDVNNVYVNSVNHGFDPLDFLDGVPAEAVVEMHLAGFTRKTDAGAPLLIDSHDARVDAAVWALYAQALKRFGPTPTLIEWDRKLPEFALLQEEAALAEGHLRAVAEAQTA